MVIQLYDIRDSYLTEYFDDLIFIKELEEFPRNQEYIPQWLELIILQK